MTIINQTTLDQESIKGVMCASNFDNTRYKTFKTIYNVFGLLFGIMLVRYLVLTMVGNESSDKVMMWIYIIATAVFLYIGMYGMDRSNRKRFQETYKKMLGVAFTYEIDSEGILVTDQDQDTEKFEWDRVIKWNQDVERIYLFVGLEECLILNKKGFTQGTQEDLRELIRAIMGIREEKKQAEKMDQGLQAELDSDAQNDIQVAAQEATEVVRYSSHGTMELLEEPQRKQIYEDLMKEDFPASELKPLDMIEKGCQEQTYEAYGYFNASHLLLGYAFFIKNETRHVMLLDYFAIGKKYRGNGLGSAFLSQIQNMCKEMGMLLVLEVENPGYADTQEIKDYQQKRISFYQKNQMNLSNVTVNFDGNEYRIMYADQDQSDIEIKEITKVVYTDFFGNDFIHEKVHFQS